MRVLGFEPGTATTGYGVVEGEGNRLHHIAHGTITTPAGEHFALRLQRIHKEARNLIAAHNPDPVAIEKLYFSKNVQTGMAVAEARGVLVLAAVERDLPIGEFSPLEVKSGVAGYGKASKRQVQEMVKILLNLDALPRPDDAADALGLAICQIHARPYTVASGERE